jgi:hypothetical protein
MSLPTPEFRAISMWPSIINVAVAAAHGYQPLPVLIVQVDHKMRTLQQFTLPFWQALRTVRR